MANAYSTCSGVYSTCLLVFSIVNIIGLVALEQTYLSANVHPAMAFCAIWGGIMLLAMAEGGQSSLVGLTPVNPEIYRETHPITYKCTAITNKGNNLDRYLLGRQFMVDLLVFLVNISGSPVVDGEEDEYEQEIWKFPMAMKNMFLTNGLAMLLFTVIVGQLNSRVNASRCMLDYINNYFALLTIYIAMAIEFTGLLHASYIVQMLVGLITGKKIVSHEEERKGFELIFFWFRCLMSLAILAFAMAVTLAALYNGETTLWNGIPPSLAVFIFFLLMAVIGMLEGMQIAFFAVAKLPASERDISFYAEKTCHLLFKDDNLPGFMIGRQLCIVLCMFFISRVTSVSIPDGGDNIFYVSDGMQKLFNTGMLGALMTIIGSISWQLVASAFTYNFLSSPLTYALLRICLFLEKTGIGSGAWVLAAIHKKLAGFKRDEAYIGTAEERNSQNAYVQLDIETGKVTKKYIEPT